MFERLKAHRSLFTEDKIFLFKEHALMILTKTEDADASEAKIEEMVDILCKIMINSVSIATPSDYETVVGIGLFEKISFMNHSCANNCEGVFFGDKMKVTTTIGIPQGQELTISYINP